MKYMKYMKFFIPVSAMRRISKNFKEGKIILNFDKKFALLRLSLYKKTGIPYTFLNKNYFNKH